MVLGVGEFWEPGVLLSARMEDGKLVVLPLKCSNCAFLTEQIVDCEGTGIYNCTNPDVPKSLNLSPPKEYPGCLWVDMRDSDSAYNLRNEALALAAKVRERTNGE